MKTPLLLAALSVPLLLAGDSCGHRVQQRPPRVAVETPRHPVDPATLRAIPVHLEGLQGIDETAIYHQLGSGSRPVLIHRKEVTYPPDHRPWGGKPGVLIVESVVAPDGRIARAKVLRGPQDETLDRALAEALQEWRFTPPRLQGKPVAVYYVLAIPVNTKK